MKVLVSDDEQIARSNMKVLLQERECISEILEADSGKGTLNQAWKHKPELIFLDIEMPNGRGIDIVRELPQQCTVIFVTAYNEYAVKAFEEEAVDYILKPFDDFRFHQAFDRALKRIGVKSVSPEGIDPIESSSSQYRKQFAVRDPGRIRLISVDELAHVAGAGNYVELHLLSGAMALHRETLSNMENQLDPKKFVRIHRSTIVRKDVISELRPNEKGDYRLFLSTGAELNLSRRFREKLKDILD